MSKFKAGDKVYCPKLSHKVVTLQETTENFGYYPLTVIKNGTTYCFTVDGKHNSLDEVPSLHHATEENHALLEKLYGMKFEAPPIKPSSKDIIQALLNSGQKYVPCYVSSGIVAPNGGSYLDFIVCVHNDGRFYNQLGGGWKYATPFDPRTGQPITEMPE